MIGNNMKKTRKKRSVIWSLDKNYIQTILDSSSSIVEVLKKLGFDPYNGNHKTINARIVADNLSVEKMLANKPPYKFKAQKPDEEVFCENSTIGSSTLKKRILSQGYLEYKCNECGNTGSHNGKSLALQLDHINGTNNDNRLVNLRLLCPNCHSQTSTFCGRRLKRHRETKEEAKIRFKNTRRFDPSKEELERLVTSMPMTKIGELFGVSDKAISKRCKLMGVKIDFGRGYWSKS